MKLTDEITVRDVFAARKRIAPFIRKTPLVRSQALSGATGVNVWLKLECEQVSRSFKVRGAANRLLQLNAEERERGVVTVSTGNHGKAVATVAEQLGLRAVVCVPTSVLPHKMEEIRKLGAEVIVQGDDQEQAEAYAAELATREGLTLISPFDEPAIIAGQGTIALEILEDLPTVKTVVVPLSGGGLLSGIALAMTQIDPNIRIVGVSMERSPVMYWSLQAGHAVQLPELPTLADSLMGGFGPQNRYTIALVRRYMDEATLVSEEEIGAAMAFALLEEGLVVEGGGAVGIAAVRAGKVSLEGDDAVIVVSGGNADMGTLLSFAGG